MNQIPDEIINQFVPVNDLNIEEKEEWNKFLISLVEYDRRQNEDKSS